MTEDPVTAVLIEDEVSHCMRVWSVDFITAVERLTGKRRYEPRPSAIVIPFPIRERV